MFEEDLDACFAPDAKNPYILFLDALREEGFSEDAIGAALHQSRQRLDASWAGREVPSAHAFERTRGPLERLTEDKWDKISTAYNDALLYLQSGKFAGYFDPHADLDMCAEPLGDFGLGVVYDEIQLQDPIGPAALHPTTSLPPLDELLKDVRDFSEDVRKAMKVKPHIFPNLLQRLPGTGPNVDWRTRLAEMDMGNTSLPLIVYDNLLRQVGSLVESSQAQRVIENRVSFRQRFSSLRDSLTPYLENAPNEETDPVFEKKSETTQQDYRAAAADLLRQAERVFRMPRNELANALRHEDISEGILSQIKEQDPNLALNLLRDFASSLATLCTHKVTGTEKRKRDQIRTKAALFAANLQKSLQ